MMWCTFIKPVDETKLRNIFTVLGSSARTYAGWGNGPTEMFWNSRTSTIFCFWDGLTYCNGTGWKPAVLHSSLAGERSFPWGGEAEDGAGLFTVVHGGWMRDNRHELKQERFKQDIRNIFSPSTSRQVHRLPRETVQSPSLEIFKTQLGKALHSWPYLEEEAGPETSWGSLQHKWLCVVLCYPSGFCPLILLHIFGYLFLCKYFDNIHLINRWMELYYIDTCLKEKESILQADQLPVTNFKLYFLKSNAMQN